MVAEVPLAGSVIVSTTQLFVLDPIDHLDATANPPVAPALVTSSVNVTMILFLFSGAEFAGSSPVSAVYSGLTSSSAAELVVESAPVSVTTTE